MPDSTSNDLGHEIATYTLYDASPDELAAICASCEKTGVMLSYGENKGYIHPAPQPRHESVAAAIAYHCALDKVGKWDADYFAIAETAEWRRAGILAVTLNEKNFAEMWSEDEDLEVSEDVKAARARGYDAHRFRPSAVGVHVYQLADCEHGVSGVQGLERGPAWGA